VYFVKESRASVPSRVAGSIICVDVHRSVNLASNDSIMRNNGGLPLRAPARTRAHVGRIALYFLTGSRANIFPSIRLSPGSRHGIMPLFATFNSNVSGECYSCKTFEVNKVRRQSSTVD